VCREEFLRRFEIQAYCAGYDAVYRGALRHDDGSTGYLGAHASRQDSCEWRLSVVIIPVIPPNIAAVSARAARNRVAGSTPAAVDWAVLGLPLTTLEKVLLPVVVALAAALHLSPILHSGLEPFLTYAVGPRFPISAPVTGIFFIFQSHVSQFVPFPKDRA